MTDPALSERLMTARRGTAYFARKLAELTDADFDAPSFLPGWSRRHVIAHVGYNARALTRLLEWAATGVETPMYPSTEYRDREIEDGVTLTPVALRHLVSHSNVHLNVEWRDLPAPCWDAIVLTAQGRSVPASYTVWMRIREVWIHAVDLDNGADFQDFPPDLVDALLADITGMWRQRDIGGDLELVPTDRPPGLAPVGRTAVKIIGSAADLTRWAAGRGTHHLTSSTGGAVPNPPRWL